jgi:hypothetical protein
LLLLFFSLFPLYFDTPYKIYTSNNKGMVTRFVGQQFVLIEVFTSNNPDFFHQHAVSMRRALQKKLERAAHLYIIDIYKGGKNEKIIQNRPDFAKNRPDFDQSFAKLGRK